MIPSWTNGTPDNLAAAAADAGEWLDLIERCVLSGHWNFSLPDSLLKLRGCIEQLERHLTEASLIQPDTSKEAP